MSEYIIRGANVLGEQVVDIHVSGGIVKAVGENLAAPGATEVNGRGPYCPSGSCGSAHPPA